jgi:hypothetical protein
LSKISVGHGNTLDLVAKLYDKLPYKLKGKVRNHSSRKVYNLLYDFHFSMKYSFGNLTYDEFRNYIMGKNPYESFIMPPVDLFPSYMKEILSDGLKMEAAKVSSEILRQYDIFKSKFEDSYNLNDLSV